MSNIHKQPVDKSNFDLSHTHKTTLDMGKLIPVACVPTLPGDEFEIDTAAFIRAMPTVAPIMDKVDIKVNHFFVPYRVLWDKFQDFITHSNNYKLNGGVAPTLPQLDGASISTFLSDWDQKNNPKGPAKFTKSMVPTEKYPREGQLGRLAEYLGVIGVKTDADGHGNVIPDMISLMPFLAYNKVFMDYYVPQRWVNYYTEKDFTTGGHPLVKLKAQLEKIRVSNNFLLNKSNFLPENATEIDLNTLNEANFGPRTNPQKDYFANILSLKNVYWNHDYFSNALPEPTLFGDIKLPMFNDNTPANQRHLIASGGSRVEFESSGNYANESDIKHNNSVFATVRDLRKAVSMQHYFEYLTQGGGRYLETMDVMWRKNLPESLLQMSQYLGGDVVNLFVNEVESTTDSVQGEGVNKTGRPLGALAGKPLGSGSFERISFEADEFGIYLALAHIVPKRSYAQNTERHWRQLEALDFPNPAFEGLGDQPVYGYELGNGAKNILGYVPRYADYKTKVDRFSGQMIRSLKQWHLGDFLQFQTEQITPEWFECKPREDIFAVKGTDDKFFGVFSFGIKATRPLSYDAPLGINRI